MDLQDGAVRLPIAWDSPAEHFALVGDLMLRLKSEGSKMLGWLVNVTVFFFKDFKDSISEQV